MAFFYAENLCGENMGPLGEGGFQRPQLSIPAK